MILGCWWWRSIGSGFDRSRSGAEAVEASVTQAASAASRSAIRSSADSMPDREPDQRRRNGERRIRSRRVRHPRRMLDEALDAAEALGELPDPRSRDELDRFLLAPDEERDHAAEVAHLARRDRVAGVRGQARVEDALHARMALEERRDRRRVRAVAVHAHRERLHAAEHEPAVERPGNRAERLLEERELLRDRRRRSSRRTRRRRPSGRRGTSSSSGARDPRRARAAAGGTASRRCCRRRRARRRRAPRPRRPRCRRC